MFEGASLSWITLAVASFLLDLYAEQLFERLKRVADPSADQEEFDFDSMARWARFEQVFQLLCVFAVFVPGWLALRSGWTFWLRLSLPRVRKRARTLLRGYLALECGFRASSTVRAVKGRNWWTLASHGTALAAILLQPSLSGQSARLLAGFLLLRQTTAIWQALFTVLQAENFVSRRGFSLGVNGLQSVLLLANCVPLLRAAHPSVPVAVAVYLLQLSRSIVGFFH